VNIDTGEKTLVEQNPGVAGYVTDDDYNVRLALNYTPTGGQVWLLPEGEGDAKTWKEFQEIGPEDAMTSSPAGFDKTGRKLYFQDSRKRNTAGFFEMNLDDGSVKLIADDPRADFGGVLAHPTEKTIEAVSFEYSRNEWKFLDDAIKADFDFLKTVQDGEIIVADRTLDDKRGSSPSSQMTARSKRILRSRAREDYVPVPESRRPHDYQLAKMHTPVIKSRDGLDLVSYLTLPPGSDPDRRRPNQPLPMVLYVHGGPCSRFMGTQSVPPVACQPRLRSAERQFRGSTGSERFHQRRQRRVGRKDARRSARRGEVGRGRRHRRQGQSRHRRRQLRRLRHSGRHAP
jgi:hypothetical protein